MFLIGFPLLLIPFVLYNIFAFIFGLVDWNAPFTSVRIISGGEWKIASAHARYPPGPGWKSSDAYASSGFDAK